MHHHGISRRKLLQVGAAGLAASTLPFGRLAVQAADPVVIGAVYVGPRDDFGWNQAHAVAMEVLKKVPGVTVLEEENVAETDAVSKSMESMINLDGANLILATSFGYYSPFVVDLAKKYPDVEFRHAAPCGRRVIRRMPVPTSAISTRRITSMVSPPARQAPRASWASLRPSRSPRSCRTSTPSCWVRARPTRTPRSR